MDWNHQLVQLQQDCKVKNWLVEILSCKFGESGWYARYLVFVTEFCMYVYLQQCIHLYTYNKYIPIWCKVSSINSMIYPCFLLLQKRWLSAISVALLKDIMPFVKGNPCWWNGMIYPDLYVFFSPTSKVSHFVRMKGQQDQMGPWDSCLENTREVVPLSYLIIFRDF